MRRINNVQDIGKIVGISIAAMLIRYFYVNYYIFGEERGILSDTGICQLYFGGLLIEQSFDLVAVSLYMLVVFLEAVLLVLDIHNGMMENLGILICRIPDKKKLYRDFMVQAMLRNVILVLLNYFLFTMMEQCTPDMAQMGIMLMFFLQTALLEMVYFTIDFAFYMAYGYIFMLLIYFSPVLFVGFMYANGNRLWRMGKAMWLHYGIYNWFHGFSIAYAESGITWDVVSYQIVGSNGAIDYLTPFFVVAILWLGLYEAGGICFRRLEII